jgi:hypothetical protein
MTFIRPSPADRQHRDAPSRRWIGLLFASLLLHVILVNWADGRLDIPSFGQKDAVVTTVLLSAPPETAVQDARPEIVRPKIKPKMRRPMVAPHPPPAPDATALVPSTAMEAPPVETEPVPASAAASAPAAAEAESATAGAVAQANALPGSRHKVSPPPSAELTYDVQATRDGRNWYGSGVFRWESTGNSYSVTGEASVKLIFKISVLNFKSEGTINEFGIAPVLYSEQPFRKSLTNTHFQHEKQKISFSASEASYPYQGGEQDRASIMWQLAGIGRGDPSQFQSGAEIDVVVAGARDADTWRIRMLGEEEIETPEGKIAAWHVTRAPRAGSYDQKIDIWLAPQREWYPVKVRYTYANGDYLDMSLSKLQPVAH